MRRRVESYAKERLTQVKECEDRARGREEKRMVQDVKLKETLARTRICSTEKSVSDDGEELWEGDSSTGGNKSSRRPKRLPNPKYVEKQDVRRYLEVLESVLKTTGYEEEDWPSTAVL